MTAPGLIIAAPASGSGKTLVTLGLLAHLRSLGRRVVSAKIGPDYIDPAFHAAATGHVCPNLDGWALRPASLDGLVGQMSDQGELVICEGVMGLFDGADVEMGQNSGSTAEMAERTGWPVVLVIDGRGMTASAAAILGGFVAHRPEISIAGVIFNKVTGDRHRRMITQACTRACPQVAVLGFLPQLADLVLPSRHLGLIQAREHPDLAAFLTVAGGAVGRHVDVERLIALARPCSANGRPTTLIPPLGQRIAVAQDDAFAFAYPAVLDGWRRAGAEITFFSPLADQAPDGDAVYLPGGYPELHGATLAASHRFLTGLRQAAARHQPIFGECGGYMVLGEALVDAAGQGHAMAGLLAVTTSFAERRLHLGYRRAKLTKDSSFGQAGTRFRAHEFHYATILSQRGDPLFEVADADAKPLGLAGLRSGSVAGSFLHLIDCHERG